MNRLSFPWAAGVLLAAGAMTSPLAAGGLLFPTLPPSPAAAPAVPDRYVRTRGEDFEIVSGAVATPVRFRGVNVGAAPPGHFPGELAIRKEEYRRYLQFARGLHANAIRIYTLHPPAFYEALREENLADPARPLWLFQGVWTELPAGNDFWDESFSRGFDQEIAQVMDAVHGQADVPPRLGHASGTYRADVSPWLAGWILGREWEPYAVRETERGLPGPRSYRGASFSIERGTAMEAWLARACDLTVERERDRYGLAHAVSFVNWPTLDPMRHPTESELGGVEAEHDEDAYAVDPARIRPAREVGVESGFLGYFATYHAYPYYPDFMNLDPGYAAHRDRHGLCNYAGYLADLKAHTRAIPLLIGEYGVPSSRGIAHLQPQGLHHGGASESEQGTQVVRLLEDIEEAGCAGSLLFSLFDEWFKSNWLVANLECARDRGPLWHNLMDAEESYGLISFDPPPRIRVDGAVDDWKGIRAYARAGVGSARGGRSRGANLLRALYVTSDASRLYLRLDAEPGALRGNAKAFGVAFDVLDPARGDHRLPPPLDATWSRGAEFVLVIEPGSAPGRARAALFADRAMNWSEFAAIPHGDSFVPHDAPFRTSTNDDGLYAPLVVRTNRPRTTGDGTRYAGNWIDTGRLRLGRQGDPGAAASPRAEWWLDRARGVIEVALPWGLLNVGDPSSHAVLDDRPETHAIECTPTAGIGLLAWATRGEGFRADSLGPSPIGVPRVRGSQCQFLGPSGTRQVVVGERVHMDAPDSISYRWNGWDRPITVEHAKTSADSVRRAFEERESRESRHHREFNAFRNPGAARIRPRAPVRRAVPHRRPRRSVRTRAITRRRPIAAS